MSTSDLPTPTVDPVAASPSQADADKALRCPKCGREIKSLRCGHCGSRLPPSQAALYGTMLKITRRGGNWPETASKGGVEDEAKTKGDNGGASTPQWLFDRCSELAVAACGEPITLDVAAAEWNHKCERYFTEEQDGLKQTWDTKAAWCNPPYSATVIEGFVRKALDAAQEGITSVLLVPWWNYPYMDLCERHGRVHRICSPVSFQRQDGTSFVMNSYHSTTQLVVVVFGPTVTPGFGAPIRNGDTTGKTDAAANADSGKRGRKVVGAMPPHRANLQNTETPPSLCQWISERLEDADVHPEILLDPCAGRGNLTRPLRGRAQVIEYEISRGRDFFEAKGIACDLVICNPPWSEAERWLRHIVKVVGNQTPMVLILPTVFFEGYKNAPVRRYLESPEAPQLSNYTPLPSDTFVHVYNNGCICWFNLPRVRNVAFVPSRYLIRCNDIDTEVAAMERNI